MKNHEQVMRVREEARLEELEKIIAKGKKTFVEVGLALAEIRDLRLYKSEYSNFADYCREKWGWTKQHAYRLIEAAPVGKSNIYVTNLCQASALAKVDPNQREGVVQRIEESGEPITAAAIKRHLPPPPEVPPGRMPGSTAGKMPAATPPPPPAEVVDGTGWAVPTHLIPLWRRGEEVQELLSALSKIRGKLRHAQDKEDALFRELNHSAAQSYADQLFASLKQAKPFAVCPTCQGQVPDKCMFCKGRGFVSEYLWNTCVTREDKEFRLKARRQPAGAVHA
jgi:hypothetical protein